LPDGQLSDQNRILRVASETADVFFVRRLEGYEGISQLYRFDVELYAERSVDIGAYVGTELLFEYDSGSEEVEDRIFGGTVMSFGFHGISPEDDHPIYRATIEPWLAYLTRRSDCRVFQSKSSIDICEEIFTRAGFEAATHFDLGNIVREKREQCVQYQETDFAFVSRLLEEDGISYFFDVTKEGVILVLADAEFRASLGPLTTRTGEAHQLSIDRFALQQNVHSGRFVTSSFNFEDPGDDFEVGSDTIITGSKRTGLEAYHFSGRYTTETDGKTMSERRMQAIESAAFRANGESSIPWMRAGMLFSLEDHPIESLNAGYLLTGVEHRMSQELRSRAGESRGEDVYANSFTAVPDARPYRPPRVTPWPRISGSQTALVVGPDGEEIHTDPHGRVKVRFHWDRWGASNDDDLQEWDSSCWVRVAQNSAGKGWGSFYLPRVGHEVVVEFLDGDPDRPIVTGTLYNGIAKPPYDTNEKKTISGVKTMTVGGGGFNEIRFDDQKGEEQIFVHAQKNYDVRILNDAFEVVKNNRHQLVEKDRIVEVRNESHDTVAQDRREKVGKDHHLDVVGKQAIKVAESRSVKVEGDVIEEFGANHSEKTSGDIYLKGSNLVIEASTKLTLKVGGSSLVLDASGATVKGSLVTIDGSMVKIASGPGSSPGSGSAGSLVEPAEPTLPEEADEADPGEVNQLRREQRAKEEGKYGNPAWVAPPALDDPSEDPAEDPDRTWIAVIVYGEDDEPIAGIPYEIEDCEGRLYHGTTGPDGKAKEYVKKGGDPKIRFPEHDEEAIEKE